MSGEWLWRHRAPPPSSRAASPLVEEGAGLGADFADDEYVKSGAQLVPGGASASAVDVVLRVGPPRPDELDPIPRGGVLVGFLAPFADGPLARRMVERGLTALALEAVPRTMLAQSLDALSFAGERGGLRRRHIGRVWVREDLPDASPRPPARCGP